MIVEELKVCVLEILDCYGLVYDIKWIYLGLLFLMLVGELVNVVKNVICNVIGVEIEFLILGGILDGCFIVFIGV